MKKIFVLLLAVIVLLSCVFVSCSKKDNDADATADGVEVAEDEYGFEVQEVTDENGKKVTDADGKAVTTEVAVKYKRDKKGKEKE